MTSPSNQSVTLRHGAMSLQINKAPVTMGNGGTVLALRHSGSDEISGCNAAMGSETPTLITEGSVVFFFKKTKEVER